MSMLSLFSDFIFFLAICIHSQIVFLALIYFLCFLFLLPFFFCSGKVLNTKLLLIGFALYVMIGFCWWCWWCCCCCCFCCGWNMVRDVGAVFTWGTEACVAFVMRIFAKQMGVLGLSGSWSGYARKIISSVQSLQKTLFFFFFFVFCFLGFW